jgi:hypothetical protein
MLPRPEPESGNFAVPAVCRPPQPYPVLFITVKAPHFIRFDADGDVFTGFKIIPVHLFYHVLFF